MFEDTSEDEDDLYLPGAVENMIQGKGDEVAFVFFFDSGYVKVVDPSYLREVTAGKTAKSRKGAKTGPATPTQVADGSDSAPPALPLPPLPTPSALNITGVDAVHSYAKILAEHSLVTSVTFAPNAKRVGRIEAAYAKDRLTWAGIPRQCSPRSRSSYDDGWNIHSCMKKQKMHLR